MDSKLLRSYYYYYYYYCYVELPTDCIFNGCKYFRIDSLRVFGLDSTFFTSSSIKVAFYGVILFYFVFKNSFFLVPFTVYFTDFSTTLSITIMSFVA